LLQGNSLDVVLAFSPTEPCRNAVLKWIMIATLPAASNSQNIVVIFFNNATDERALRNKITLG
jgi:hypothetical protein